MSVVVDIRDRLPKRAPRPMWHVSYSQRVFTKEDLADCQAPPCRHCGREIRVGSWVDSKFPYHCEMSAHRSCERSHRNGS